MTKARLKRAAALIFGLSLAVVAWDRPIGNTVELEGYVFTARDATGKAVDPAVGAVVSISLDSAVAVTDKRGWFHLRTGRRVSGDEFYTIAVQSRGMAFRKRSMAVQHRSHDFVLTPSGNIDSYPSSQRRR